MDNVLAHNTEEGAPGIPLIIETPEYFPFADGERETEWHDATEEEYSVYLAYWDAQDDEQD